MFYHWTYPHLAAPASAGHLHCCVLKCTLDFVQHDLFVAIFGFTVVAMFESQSGEHFLQAFYPVVVRRPLEASS